MGRALYRTHRSTSFDTVIGQDHITHTLKNAVKKQAISHAYLFTGPRGTGKTSVARILAHEINGLPYSGKTHLDIIEIDAASNRRIDEIRDLRDKVHIAPTSAHYKVYIIDEVHMLTREAFNALLKTLEEPPEHAVFILATTELHKVPETIVSRAQRYTFRPITQEHAVVHLRTIADAEKLTITDDALSALATHGNGSFRDSISMLDQLSGLQRDEYTLDDVKLLLGIPDDALISTVLAAIQTNDTPSLFDAVQQLKQQGVDTTRAAQALSSRVREGLIHQETAPIDNTKALPLLKSLLLLTNGAHEYVALELAALSVMQQDQATHVQPVASKQQKPNDHSIQTPTKPSQPQPTTKSATTNTVDKDFRDKELPAEETQKNTDAQGDQKLPVKPQVQNRIPKPLTPIAAKEPLTNAQPATEPILEYPADLTGQWQQLLTDVKKDYNTLYGVLRMAKIRVGQGGPVLTFAFDFHKKRVESGAHKQTLGTFMNKHFKTETYSIQVKKQDQPTPSAPAAVSEKPPETDAKQETDPSVESVSNIFGSVELLE